METPTLNLSFLPNLASSAVLSGILLYLWFRYRERHLAFWAVAAGLWMVRYLWGLFTPLLPQESVFTVLPLLALARGLALVSGGSAITGQRLPRWWLAVAGGAVLWLLVAPDEAIVSRLVPSYLAFGGMGLWTGGVLIQAKGLPRLERTFAGGVLVVYGALQWSFPWRTALPEWFAATNFLAASTVQVLFALSIVLVYFRGEEERLEAAHASLSTALRKALGGHLDLCSGCHAVRGADGGWTALEAFVSQRTGTSFSHGICPSCLETHYGDFFEREAETPAL